MSAITALIKLCPTRVRTEVPPFSAMISGTTFEQIRLYSTVAPGSFSSTCSATSAVVSEPETPAALASTRNTRSASPSKAKPISAPTSSTRAFRSARFSSLSGSAG